MSVMPSRKRKRVEKQLTKTQQKEVLISLDPLAASASAFTGESAISGSGGGGGNGAVVKPPVSWHSKYDELEKQFEALRNKYKESLVAIRNLNRKVDVTEKDFKTASDVLTQIRSEVATCPALMEDMKVPVVIPECGHVLEFGAVEAFMKTKLEPKKSAVAGKPVSETVSAAPAECPVCRTVSERSVENLTVVTTLITLRELLDPESKKLDYSKIRRPGGAKTNVSEMAKVSSSAAEPVKLPTGAITSETIQKQIAEAELKYQHEYRSAETWADHVVSNHVLPRISRELAIQPPSLSYRCEMKLNVGAKRVHGPAANMLRHKMSTICPFIDHDSISIEFDEDDDRKPQDGEEPSSSSSNPNKPNNHLIIEFAVNVPRKAVN